MTFFTKNAEKSAQFFIDVFGLKINQYSESYSEIVDNNNFKMVFMQNESEAHTRTAFNPLLTFNVANFEETKKKLDSYDIDIDGDEQDNQLGKYVCIKSPDGIMCIIYEAKNPELDEEDFNVDFNDDAKQDPNTAEIRNMLNKIKL